MSKFASIREQELQVKVTALETELLAVRYANKIPIAAAPAPAAEPVRRLTPDSSNGSVTGFDVADAVMHEHPDYGRGYFFPMDQAQDVWLTAPSPAHEGSEARSTSIQAQQAATHSANENKDLDAEIGAQQAAIGPPSEAQPSVRDAAGLYEALRAMHWTDKKLTVIEVKDVPLGVQTYSGKMLDEAILAATEGASNG